MALFVVTYVHPDGDGWDKYLPAHIEYLLELLKEGKLRASGPLTGTPQRSALLILSAPSREETLAIIEKDPYKTHGLVTEMTVTEWDPIFGAFHADSSRA